MVPGRGALQARRQPRRRRVADVAQEGQRDVPGIPAGPAQARPPRAQRGHGGLKFVERRGRRREGDEQSHHGSGVETPDVRPEGNAAPSFRVSRLSENGAIGEV